MAELEAEAAAAGGEAPQSQLGRLEYWASVYSRELANFDASEGEDNGVDWFSENVRGKLVKWLAAAECVDKDAAVLDVGCGNAQFLVELHDDADWRGRLVGVDYSGEAVELARKNTSLANVAGDFREATIQDLSAHLEQRGETASYGLVHDKGTFDAYMLADGASLQVYAAAVLAALSPAGVFIVTSCNHTTAELQRYFTVDEPSFKTVDTIAYPTFCFGGVTGAAVATVAFKLAIKS
ncbi:S-adenosyl-L-methionine-dependent methyltransferase [Pelagophyceae sp. CCMP2097]|nr:S-adenosyl-L-methionine-dependent methyltransferase [Pelagophyceae sp. CCMP2097]